MSDRESDDKAQWSALLDDEVGEFELRRRLQDLESMSAEERASTLDQLGRWALMGDLLRKEANETGLGVELGVELIAEQGSLVDRVNRVISDDVSPVIHDVAGGDGDQNRAYSANDAPQKASAWRMFGGLSVAASVAAMVVVLLSPNEMSPNSVPGGSGDSIVAMDQSKAVPTDSGRGVSGPSVAEFVVQDSRRSHAGLDYVSVESVKTVDPFSVRVDPLSQRYSTYWLLHGVRNSQADNGLEPMTRVVNMDARR